MGDQGAVRLKMRLRAVLALLFLVALVSAARNGARGSGSRRTSSNCRGSSSRSSSSSSGSSPGGRRSTLCRPTTTTAQTDQARPSSNSNSFGVTKRPPINRPTKKATRKTTVSSSSTNSANSDNSSLRGFTKSTTRTIPKKTVTKKFTLPKKTRRTTNSSTDQESVSDSIKSTTKILPKTAPKRFKPPKKTRKTTVSSAAPDDEENSSDSSTNTKTPAKKYFQKLKNRLQTAAIWFVENKDKTLDEILVDRWKEKCPGGASTKNKRKRCVSDALAESDDDTPEEKLVKDALKSLLEEDSDEAYEFLSTSSSKTFGDIENVEETQDISTSENSNSSRNSIRKRLPTKRSKVISTSGNSGSSGNKLRKFNLPVKKVKPTPHPDSTTDTETDSGSSTKRRIKTSAKKYLQKVKDKLKNAAVWYLENKDKTIDDILVDKWKEKCPGGISTKKKRKQCVSDALADSDDDTPEEKEMKDALKSLVEEDSDGAYDFL